MARTRNIIQLRSEVRQRADMVNSAFVTDFEVDRAILQSCAQLYDEMCATGEDYFIKYVDITTPNGGFYDFASYHASDGFHATDVYQVRGVDAVYSDNVVVNLPRFNWEERNIYAATPTLVPYYPVVAYRVMQNPVTGLDAIELIPDNSNGMSKLRVWYYPNPKNSAYIASIVNPKGSPVVSLLPGVYYNVAVSGGSGGGMRATVVIDATGAIQSVEVTSYNGPYTNQFTYEFNNNAIYSGSPKVESVGLMSLCQFDGRAGWEEWVVVDAASKLLAKEESDTSQLDREAARIWARIMKNMSNRDAGQSKRVTDVAYNTGAWPYSSGFPRRF
jgi:hypothetical protein